MLKLNGDIIRQLNNIYGLKFKEKYKKEIKERIKNIIKNMYKDISFQYIENLKEYIELKDLELVRIKEKFFIENKYTFLAQINNLWYIEKEIKYKPTIGEKKHTQALILEELLTENLYEDKRLEKYIEFKDKYGDAYFTELFEKMNVIAVFRKEIKKYIKNNKYKFIKKSEDYVLIKNELIEVYEALSNGKNIVIKWTKKNNDNFNIINKQFKNKEFDKIDLTILIDDGVIDLYNMTVVSILIEKVELKLNELQRC